jgi:hypothetical protein
VGYQGYDLIVVVCEDIVQQLFTSLRVFLVYLSSIRRPQLIRLGKAMFKLEAWESGCDPRSAAPLIARVGIEPFTQLFLDNGCDSGFCVNYWSECELCSAQASAQWA